MANAGTTNRKVKLSYRVQRFLERTFLEKKLNNWIGYVFFFFLAVALGSLLAKNVFLGFGVVGLVMGFALVLVCLLDTRAGFYINMAYSFFAFHLSRLFFNDQFPVGVLSDIFILATFFSLFITQTNLRKIAGQFTRKPVVICTMVLYAYIGLELFNPEGHAFDTWFLIFRKSVMTLLLLFIAWNIFDSYASVRRFIINLFILCTIAGLYGCIQEWHGLFDFERNWVMSDDTRFGLMYINGSFRKFSTFSDPTAYGLLMGACSVFFLIIAWHQKRKLYRNTLLAGTVIMLLGMAYSGTRTANAMVVAGFAIFILLTIDRRTTRIFAVVSTVSLLIILYGPFYNPTIERFRSTFVGSEDESYKVRDIERMFIQPYMHSHPFGGGMGTTGARGYAHNAGHPLAGYNTDSGYLKKALEAGWIGLILICVLYFTVLRAGIRGYFGTHDPKIKLIYGASVSFVFAFYIADYAQDAIGQITDIVVYYPIMAIILKLKYFDRSTEKGTGKENVMLTV